MSQHVLGLNLGPVQDFIAAARRTRDLWYGSQLLSDLCRAAAVALRDAGAELVFPAAGMVDDPGASVANKLVAVVPDGTDPEALARAARRAAQDKLVELANAARGKAGALVRSDADACWDEQIATLLEFVAAWAPVEAGGYADALEQVDQASAGRKNLREFSPWSHQLEGAYKSGLDGGRSDVLVGKRDGDVAKLVRKFRISAGEHLDAVGVLKRCGGDPGQFVPLGNVGIADWLARAETAAPAELAAVRAACARSGYEASSAQGISRVRSDLPCTELFGWDAAIFMPDRAQEVASEAGLGDRLPEDLTRAIDALFRKVGQPHPYVCCLLADGDRMGQAIQELRTREGHADLTQALSQFAPAAREIVQSPAHLGALVYAGGDDVLAFVPVAKAVKCAKALSDKFASLFASDKFSDLSQRPTLSVGLAVAHVQGGLSDLRGLARQAEKLAKLERNSLAIVVDKRSGGTDEWTASWNDEPVATLLGAVALLGGRLPRGKVSEVRDLLRRSPDPKMDGAQRWSAVLRCDVAGILARSKRGQAKPEPADTPDGQPPVTPAEAGGKGRIDDLTPEEVGLVFSDPPNYAKDRRAVDRWVNRMRVAMMLADASGQRREVD